jgi:DNA polymerase I-like protein with 3'-5' exonuclease and polymerase domains
MRRLFLDTETNSTHDHIWCCYTYNEDGYVCHTEATTLIPLIENSDKVIGHNLIGFDAGVLKRCWGVKIPAKKAIDTLILSRLYNPNLEGGHSLAAWGERTGQKKTDYAQAYEFKTGLLASNRWDNPDLGLLYEYCKDDVAALVATYDMVTKMLEKEQFSEQSIKLEHDVAIIIQRQKEHGFRLDIKKAQSLLAMLQSKMVDIENTMQDVFPPYVESGRKNKRTGAPLKDIITPFNPGSRQQIAERLEKLGVKFTKKTDKGAVIVDETVLVSIDLPEAKLLSEYLMLQKRVAQIGSWLEEVKDTGRVHGSVITNGAVTGRMTHSSPNMAQVPNKGSPYGEDCRELWVVDEGNVLVGADASGLELRMLAHYMKDDAYIKTVCEGSSKDGTDVHTQNQKAAGLATRDEAKTFIYAFLYGAGSEKIGKIVGGNARDGQKLIESFLSNTPALKTLRNNVSKYASKGFVPGLDGRKIWVRSEHSAVNSLLQGAGAIVMKQALVLLDEQLRKKKIWYGFCVNVHDEWQIETKEKDGELVGQLAVQSIQKAGELLGLRCPVSGEFNTGKTWRDTH